MEGWADGETIGPSAVGNDVVEGVIPDGVHLGADAEVFGDGKVGAAGQTQKKTFPSADKAQAEADKLIQEKLKKGYIELTPKPGATYAEAFEQALAADPQDLAEFM